MKKKIEDFITKPIADTKSGVAAIFSLSLDSVDEVNSLIERGLNAGVVEPSEMREG